MATKQPDGRQVYCRVCLNKYNNDYARVRPARVSLRTLKARAHRSGCPTTVTEEELVALLAMAHCFYCDRSVQSWAGRLQGTNRGDDSASFDRVNSSEGYTAANVVLSCTRCNRIKNDGTAAEHRRIADKMDEHAARRAAAK